MNISSYNRLDYMRDLLALIMQLKSVEPSSPLVAKAEKLLSEFLDDLKTSKIDHNDAI